MATFANMTDWLAHLETVHKTEIDLGLTRVGEMKTRLQTAGLLKLNYPIITVGGTNGKGSTCAYLEQILMAAGYKVGCHTSPHVLDFTERASFNGEDSTEAQLLPFFHEVERVRVQAPEISLTYFEFTLLVFMCWFDTQQPDAVVLEVGLGGRLDAVNVFDADCAVVTSVDLDHQAFLGDTVEKVAFEKAGVFRSGKAAVCGQNPPPQSLQQHAEAIGAELLLIQRDFDYVPLENVQWTYRYHPQHTDGLARNRNALPMPALRGAYQTANAACALTVLEVLHSRLPVDIGAIKRGLVLVENPGRFQVLPGRPLTVLDVGHNPHAARALRRSLINLAFAQKRIAVFSMLSDKDIDGVLDILKDQFDEWNIAPLDLPRGMSAEMLQAKMAAHDIDYVQPFADVQSAYQAALAKAGENDRIVVFGSFHTVAEVMATL